MKQIAKACLVLAGAGLALPTAATVTQFAAYGALPGQDTLNFLYTNGTSPTISAVTTSTGDAITDGARARVAFAYSVDGISSTPITAYMTYSLSSDAASSRTSNIQSMPFTGTISFTPVEDSAAGSLLAYTTASNLLTVTFNASATEPTTLWRTATARALSGGTGNIPDYGADYDPNSVLFSSDFLRFDQSNGTERQASITFSGDHALNNSSNSQFIAASIGTFSTDPAPVALTSAVPEVGTWGMMLAGFGGVGGTLRRRQGKLAVA